MNTELNKPSGHPPQSGVLFNLSFRIFFLAAGVFSIVSILLWALIYLFQFPLPIEGISNSQWHAHEMIYGYAMAVICGFLLTAAKNWTGVQTLNGRPLMGLFVLWLGARLIFLSGTAWINAAALLDMAFALMFVGALAQPIIQVKQWKQLAIVSKVLLLGVFNALFYLGVLGIVEQGVAWGLYGGLFMVISLILTLGRRVVPFFIEKGVDEPAKLSNSKWIDLSNLVLFLSFTLIEVFMQQPALSAWLAVALFVLNVRRLIGWYTPGIWRKSLLWSLYLSFWLICLGFALFAAAYFLGLNKFLAIHAFAVGGIGTMTLAMMSRIALGHSGRGIQNPPDLIAYAFVLLLSAALFRVLLPLLDSGHYTLWIALSQFLWIAAFSIFTLLYLPILSKPRVDGRPG